MDRRATAFSQALSQAIAHEQLALKQVRRRLADMGCAVSMATLSYWRSGQRQPEGPRSHEAVAALESVLSLRPGQLAKLLGPSRRPSPDPGVPFEAQVGLEDVARIAREELGFDHLDGLSARSFHLNVRVDLDGWVDRASIRTTWRSRSNGVRRTLAHIKTDDPTAEPPEIVAVAGCTIGDRHYDPPTGLVTAVVNLPRAIDRGDVVMTEFAFVGRMSTERERYYAVSAPRRTSETGIRVEFAPGRLPARCHLQVSAESTDVRRPAPLVDGSVSHVAEEFGPGSVGIHWEWADSPPT